jgi:hypothetical protein
LAIMMMGALVLVDVTAGIMDASIPRSPSVTLHPQLIVDDGQGPTAFGPWHEAYSLILYPGRAAPAVRSLNRDGRDDLSEVGLGRRDSPDV